MRFNVLQRRYVLVGVLIAGALSQYLLDPLRPKRLEDRAGSELVVSNAGDAGPGSFREALFSAARSAERPIIRIKVPRITLTNPLPPVTHAQGIIIEGNTQAAVIDAKALGRTVVLDVQSPNVVIRNLTIEEAAGTAILLRVGEFLAENLSVNRSDIAMTVASSDTRLRVSGAAFRDDRVGIQINASTTGVIQHSHFEHNTETGLWAVLAPTAQHEHRGLLQLSENTFNADRDSIVLANIAVTVEKNEFSANEHNAISVLAGEATLRANTIRGAGGAGIFADGVTRALITGNDIGQCPGTGLFLRSASNVVAEKNRLYSNSYGIVTLFSNGTAPVTLADNLVFSQKIDGLMVIGASPVIRSNHFMRNGGAGIRILDIVAAGQKRTTSAPLLNGNTLAGNLLNEVFHGDYKL